MAAPTDDEAVAALCTAVRHRTISHPDPDRVDHAPFEALIADLARLFPRLHATAELERIEPDGLLFRWPGADPAKDPVVLMAHLDVVPVNPDDRWQHPPFDGVVADGMIWGRGTLDCKGSAVAICTAVERLIADSVTPARDVWLSFGCDEEVSGSSAPAAVARLVERGVTPWFVLDEGGVVASQAFPGVAAPVAVIGTTEKGTVDVELRATAQGGHASMPPRQSATGRLARAILRIENHPFPAHLPEPTIQMLEAIAPHATGPIGRFAGQARRLRAPLAQIFARLGPETAAMTRTTTAVTQLTGSPAANVLASTASATVNMRVMVGQSVGQAVDHLRRVIADRQIAVQVRSADEPSPLSPTDDPAYRLLVDVTAQVIPDAVAVPYVVMAATDSRHFHRVWPRVYRFNPFRLSPSQRASLHNVDERLEVDSYLEGIRWYERLVTRL